MSDPDLSALGSGDSSDLAWARLRYAEIWRTSAELRAELDAGLEALKTSHDPELGAALTERMQAYMTLQRDLIAAKNAVDDAYALTESLLPAPAAEEFATPAERDAWVSMMRSQAIEATERHQALREEFDALPADETLEKLAAATSDAERLSVLDDADPLSERRIDLILGLEQAEKDVAAALAALDRLDPSE